MYPHASSIGSKNTIKLKREVSTARKHTSQGLFLNISAYLSAWYFKYHQVKYLQSFKTMKMMVMYSSFSLTAQFELRDRS